MKNNLLLWYLPPILTFILVVCLLRSIRPVVENTDAKNLKICAQALVVIKTINECTALSNLTPPQCSFTMADILVKNTALADKQVYCPVLQPGEEGANN